MSDLPTPPPAMQVNFIVHDADGRILRSGMCPYDILDRMAGDGETVRVVSVMVPSDDSFWVIEGELAPGIPMTPTISKTEIAADGVDEAVIAGLPDPCSVWIQGAVRFPPTEVAGGSITLTSTERGRVLIRVSAANHRALEVEIHAV